MNGYVVTFVELLLQILSFAILLRVLSSWVDPYSNHWASQLLRDLTEPVLGPIRSVLPGGTMFDFSPIIAMVLLQALGRLVSSV